MSLRSSLYRLASILGDINAIAKGKIITRLMRKHATKRASRFINKVIK